MTDMKYTKEELDFVSQVIDRIWDDIIVKDVNTLVGENDEKLDDNKTSLARLYFCFLSAITTINGRLLYCVSGGDLERARVMLDGQKSGVLDYINNMDK